MTDLISALKEIILQEEEHIVFLQQQLIKIQDMHQKILQNCNNNFPSDYCVIEQRVKEEYNQKLNHLLEKLSKDPQNYTMYVWDMKRILNV